MGGVVGVDAAPVQLNQILSPEGTITQHNDFPANLKAWRFSAHPLKRCVTSVDPVDWGGLDGFDPKCCYLLLLSYSVSEAKAQFGAGSDVMEEAQVLALAQSAAGSISPRGLASPFSSGEDNPSFAFMNSGHLSHSFGVFLWNGLQADPVVKATALTKAFALERQLIEQQECLQKAYKSESSSLVSKLSKQNHAAPPSADQNTLLDNNELFQWLLKGPRRSFERHQDGPWPNIAQTLTQPAPVSYTHLTLPTKRIV
eukprot:TRINITY_DN8885_c0_g1_i4.p1 TRINITY_DN8885_c0_g1~~TRINITY_DN8885_c0_g1_i4.p1  ORF type:complete len:256 (+),score=60.28 TRINITY_DN8885_c0_g1_i4:140-907(+)